MMIPVAEVRALHQQTLQPVVIPNKEVSFVGLACNFNPLALNHFLWSSIYERKTYLVSADSGLCFALWGGGKWSWDQVLNWLPLKSEITRSTKITQIWF